MPWCRSVRSRPISALRRSGSAATRADRAHAAPLFEPAERPGRHLLQADDVGMVGGDELDHLAEIRAPLRREGVAVKEIPRADEHRHAA